MTECLYDNEISIWNYDMMQVDPDIAHTGDIFYYIRNDASFSIIN